MKKVVLEFDDDEVELLQQQLNQIQDAIGVETLEDLFIMQRCLIVKQCKQHQGCLDKLVILKN